MQAPPQPRIFKQTINIHILSHIHSIQKPLLKKIVRLWTHMHDTREIHPLDPQPHRYCMLASTASAPRITRCSLGLYWSRDLCSRGTGWLIGWLGDVIFSRSDSERQRNLMMQDQRPLPVYYSQMIPRIRVRNQVRGLV